MKVRRSAAVRSKARRGGLKQYEMKLSTPESATREEMHG
jgi:hypothetical protein